MTLAKMMATALSAGMLAACASSAGPLVSASEPHGIVDLDIPRLTANQYEAFFQQVDGQNLVVDRKQLLLKPGKHEIKLGAKLHNLYGADAMSVPGGRNSEHSVVTIDVKEGIRYSVAAKLDGNRTDQWVAIVSREAPMAGYANR